jgi:hypothetical protein
MKRLFFLPLVFALSTFAGAQTQPAPGTLRTLPAGTEIKVRTDSAIPAKPAVGAAFNATVSNDATDANGTVLIPKGSPARLVAERTADGKDTSLDLRSVTVNGQRFNIVSSEGAATGSSTPGGLGANKRTAKYVGGGAVIGTLLGALIGGGKGAAVGAILGGAGGAGAQVYTGKKNGLPAETELTFKTAQALQLRPAARRSGGLQQRPAAPATTPQ